MQQQRISPLDDNLPSESDRQWGLVLVDDEIVWLQGFVRDNIQYWIVDLPRPPGRSGEGSAQEEGDKII